MLCGIYSAICELLVHRCEKCVEIKGDYVEKQQSCFICHLKKLVRPETFGPYCVYMFLMSNDVSSFVYQMCFKKGHSVSYIKVVGKCSMLF